MIWGQYPAFLLFIFLNAAEYRGRIPQPFPLTTPALDSMDSDDGIPPTIAKTIYIASFFYNYFAHFIDLKPLNSYYEHRL